MHDMYKFLNKSTLVIASASVLIGSSNTAIAGEHMYWSSCGHKDAMDVMATLDLGTWFDNFESSLRGQPEYFDFVSLLSKQLNHNENVVCTFSIDRNGIINNLRIRTPSSKENIDNQLLSLVKKIKFAKTPNNLPEVKGVEIEFWKQESKILFWSQLNRATRYKKYEYVNYFGPNSILPFESRTIERDRGLFRGEFGQKLAI